MNLASDVHLLQADLAEQKVHLRSAKTTERQLLRKMEDCRFELMCGGDVWRLPPKSVHGKPPFCLTIRCIRNSFTFLKIVNFQKILHELPHRADLDWGLL